MEYLHLSSFAKVNLTLEVSTRRADGYHDLDSIVQVIDLRDELILSRAPVGIVEVTVESGDAPSGPDNLVHHACEAFLQSTGIRSGVRCILRKTIPAQAGLGGGSGNAAAVIAGLNKLFECGLSIGELSGLAASVGSDAVLFLHGGTTRMRGRGDLVEPLPDAPVMHLIVIKPNVGVSTAWAYSELDKHGREGISGRSNTAEKAIRAGDRSGLVSCLCNDFDPVVSESFEEIRNAKDLLLGLGAEAALLSGSGSAVFGIFGSEQDARTAALRIPREVGSVFVTRSLTRAESSLI